LDLTEKEASVPLHCSCVSRESVALLQIVGFLRFNSITQTL